MVIVRSVGFGVGATPLNMHVVTARGHGYVSLCTFDQHGSKLSLSLQLHCSLPLLCRDVGRWIQLAQLWKTRTVLLLAMVGPSMTTRRNWTDRRVLLIRSECIKFFGPARRLSF